MRKIPPFLLLDAWRGFAALWVVMGHACVAFLATGDHGRYIHFPLYEVSIWAQLGVVMFFVISGYCIMGAAYGALATGRGPGHYALDRIRRIYPPYLAACFLAISLNSLLELAQRHHFLPPAGHPLDHFLLHQPKFWISNILLLQKEFSQPTLLFVAWSLYYEIVFYFLLGGLLILARSHVFEFSDTGKILVFQIGIACLTFTSLVWLILSPESCPFPLDRWYQFGLGAQFFLVCAAKSGFPTRFAHAQLIGAGTLLLLFAFLYDSPFVLGHPSTRLQAATSLIFVAILWALRPYDAYFSGLCAIRPFMWLGTISYSLYLIHPLVMAFPDVGGRRLGFDNEWYWVTYLLEIAVAIIAGWLFYLTIECHFISGRQKQRVKMELGK